MNEDINVVLIDFPSTKAYEMCVENEEGNYTILINSRMTCERQHEAYEHALDHIKHNDFEKDSVQEVEAMAHGLIPRET